MHRKREWATTVYEEFRGEGLLVAGNQLVFHAGQDYYGELCPLLAEKGVEIEIPTGGLRYGETLAWYNEQL